MLERVTEAWSNDSYQTLIRFRFYHTSRIRFLQLRYNSHMVFSPAPFTPSSPTFSPFFTFQVTSLIALHILIIAFVIVGDFGKETRRTLPNLRTRNTTHLLSLQSISSRQWSWHGLSKLHSGGWRGILIWGFQIEFLLKHVSNLDWQWCGRSRSSGHHPVNCVMANKRGTHFSKKCPSGPSDFESCISWNYMIIKP